MKIIFAGTPNFSVPCLEALLQSSYEIVAVYTQPDRPAGRGQKLTESPVKQIAREHDIPIYQPTDLRTEVAQDTLKTLNADLMVVVAYGLLLPSAVLNIPRRGCINVHASLLPRWRGASPIQQAILAGDKETGITLMQMDAGLDTGPLLQQACCPIEPTDTSQTLHDKLAKLGAKTLLTSLSQIDQNAIQAKPQDETHASYAPKLMKQAAEIDWQQSASQIERRIRAFNPWPVAHTHLGDRLLRIWEATVLPEKPTAPPGTLVQASPVGLDIATGNGMLRLQRIQLPGGKPLAVGDVLNARQELFSVGSRLGRP